MAGFAMKGWSLPAPGGHWSAVGVTGIGRSVGDNIPTVLPRSPVPPGLQISIIDQIGTKRRSSIAEYKIRRLLIHQKRQPTFWSCTNQINYATVVKILVIMQTTVILYTSGPITQKRVL